MKNCSLCLFALLLLSNVSLAQTVIDASYLDFTYPKTYLYGSIGNVEINPEQGTGLVWDFSNLDFTYESNRKVDISEEMPIGYCPDCDFGEQGVLGIKYFSFESEGVRFHRSYTSLLLDIYEEPFITLPIPVEYGTELNQDVYIGRSSIDGGDWHELFGSCSVNCVGDGMLILPGVTFDNVLLLHTSFTMQDSIPFLEGTTIQEWEYFDFYNAEVQNPILTWEKKTRLDLDGEIIEGPILFLLAYKDDVSPVSNIFQDKISVFPNPFNEFVDINVPSDVISVRIINSLGVEVERQPVGMNPKFRIRTNHLNSGVYYFEFENTKGRITKKLVKI